MPLLTLWCLLPARWGDGLSVDAAIRGWWRGLRSPVPRLRDQVYGFAVWLPGLTLGSALAAAAFAKLHRSGAIISPQAMSGRSRSSATA